MSDNDWEDLVSILPIKNQHLLGAALEGSAYPCKLPNINSKCYHRAVCISPTPYLLFFHLHIGTHTPKLSRVHELSPLQL